MKACTNSKWVMPGVLFLLGVLIGLSPMEAAQSPADNAEPAPPAQSRPVSKEAFEKIVGEAMAALKSGDLELARKDFSAIVEMAPNFVEAHRLLGYVYLQQGDPAQALRSFERAVDLGLRRGDVYYTMAVIWSQTGDFPRARNAYLEAVKYSPEMAAAYQNLGLLYYEMGQTEEAVGALLKALDLNKDSTKTMFALGTAYVKLGKPELAVEYVTSLRLCNEETMAVQLENLIRGSKQSRDMPEPDASNLIPDSPAQRAPVSPGRSAPKVSVTGKAKVSLSGKSAQ